MTVFTNGDFISFDEHDTTYSVMVVNKKYIAYMGYNIPICYDNEKVIDLQGKAVVPLLNERIKIDCGYDSCRMLAEGESADFAILDRNILKEPEAEVLEIFIKGKKKKVK